MASVAAVGGASFASAGSRSGGVSRAGAAEEQGTRERVKAQAAERKERADEAREVIQQRAAAAEAEREGGQTLRVQA